MGDKGNSTLRVDVPGFDAAQIAREAVAIKLTEAMLGADDVVRKIVVAAMGQKVSERGVVSSSSYENKTPFVEWMAGDLIRAAALVVMKQKVAALQPLIEKSIEAQLRSSVKAHAKALTASFIENAQRGYGISVKIELSVENTR